MVQAVSNVPVPELVKKRNAIVYGQRDDRYWQKPQLDDFRGLSIVKSEGKEERLQSFAVFSGTLAGWSVFLCEPKPVWNDVRRAVR